MKMEYVVEIVRGWPQDGALDRQEPIKAGVSLKNGDFVAKQSDGTVDLSAAAANKNVGVVIQGNGDSPSAAASGKALVLWSNYIAKVGAGAYAAGAYAPGTIVTAKSGKLALGVAGTDPELGTVLDVITASATEDAALIILVK